MLGLRNYVDNSSGRKLAQFCCERRDAPKISAWRKIINLRLISGDDSVENDVREVSILSELEAISRHAGPRTPPQIHCGVCRSLIAFPRLRGATNKRNENEERGR